MKDKEQITELYHDMYAAMVKKDEAELNRVHGSLQTEARRHRIIMVLFSLCHEVAQDIRWMSVWRRPERSVDLRSRRSPGDWEV